MKRKAITTTLEIELLKEVRLLATELEVGVNQILEVSYKHLKNSKQKIEIEIMIKKNKDVKKYEQRYDKH